MPFNKSINGFENEEEFANYLNGKKFGRINNIFQDLLYALYKKIDFNDIINCWVNYSKKKADIYIKVNDKVRGISIKKGVKNSVHIEPLKDFIKFLKNLGVSEKYINEIKKYHYADGTINGTGNNRITTKEYKIGKEELLKKINLELNSDKVISEAINRFVLMGNNANIEIDAIIYGVIDDFIWITKDEIKYIINRRKNIISSSLHFGSLYYQPMNRNIIRNPKYEKERDKIQIKWYNISDDIIEVMATYRQGLILDDNGILEKI